MIVFGCSITSPDMYREAAERGFTLVAEPDSVIMANGAAGSLMRSYNVIMNKAAEMDGVEALVPCHQDAELTPADFKAVHHHSLELISDQFVWIEAHKRVAEKWLGRMPPAGLPNWGAADYDWKGRALQAEAEAGAERLTRVSIQMKAEAQARRHN